MNRSHTLVKLSIVLLVAGMGAALSSCSNKNPPIAQATVDSLNSKIALLTAESALTEKNLQKFDTLDYNVFSNRDWVRLHESHSENIKVNWPDGHVTNGLERHIADLTAMFVYAPNTSIKQHPIRFGVGNMTCVTGVMTGTFSAPMPAGVGKFIQPTGKSFSLNMCTIGIWKDGVMTEEYLFWDNQSFMTQIGL